MISKKFLHQYCTLSSATMSSQTLHFYDCTLGVADHVVVGSTVGFLEVVDLLAGQVRYIPVPEPQHESAYASWYKQTYPDKVSI